MFTFPVYEALSSLGDVGVVLEMVLEVLVHVTHIADGAAVCHLTQQLLATTQTQELVHLPQGGHRVL